MANKLSSRREFVKLDTYASREIGFPGLLNTCICQDFGDFDRANRLYDGLHYFPHDVAETHIRSVTLGKSGIFCADFWLRLLRKADDDSAQSSILRHFL